MLVRIATSADSPPRSQGKVVELDRFSAQVLLETPEPTLRQGASVWLHFDPPGGGSSLSVAGIISGVARGGRITVLLSLSPREYSRLRGLPEPPAPRSRRAAQPPSTLPGIKPIPKPEAPERRPEPGSSPPGQPVETPAAVEPDLASLSPIDRVRALAAAMEEMVGSRTEPASARPVEPAETPPVKVETQPASVSPTPPLSPLPMEPAELVAPQPEPASVSPVEPVEAPAVIEPSAEPTWLRPSAAAAPVELVEPPPEPVGVIPSAPVEPPVEPVAPEPEPVSASPLEPAEIEPSAEPAWLQPAEEAEAPVELVEPPLEPVGVFPAAPVEPPVELVAPEPEPVSASPVEPAEAPAVIESSDEPEWLRPAEEAEAPVELVEAPLELVEPPLEAAGVSPPESVEAPAEVDEPAPEPVEAPPPAAKPSVVRPGLFSRLAAALVGMTGPRAEPAPPTPVEAEVETQPASVSTPPPEAPAVIESSDEPEWLQPAEEAEEEAEEPAGVSPAEPSEEAPAVIEFSDEPAWLQPAEEAEEEAEEPAGVSPREQAEALIIRGDLEGAWKIYYDALRVEPDDLSLWYGLGRTLSRLNRRKETQEIFQYVVSRGDPDSEEVKHARQWLVRAGLLAEPAAPAVPAAPRRRAEPWATVRGKVTWGRPEPPREAFLVVQGLGKDAPRLHARVQFGQRYQFERLPAGAYHLVGGAETEWLWDLRFAVEAGQELILDLSRDNSTNPTARV